MTTPTLGAILLAGGRASRMGGIPKPLLEVGGRSMLQAAIDGCRGVGCDPITVVADPARSPTPAAALPEASRRARLIAPPDDPRITWTREDPPFGGPAAAVVAALRSWDRAPSWTFVLACDLPRIGAAVRQLADDILLLPSDTDGMCLADASSRPQWLTGVYRTAALAGAAAALGDAGRDASMRTMLADLAIAVVTASGDLTADIDTWDDYTRLRG